MINQKNFPGKFLGLQNPIDFESAQKRKYSRAFLTSQKAFKKRKVLAFSDKKGSELLSENVIFIILNVVFISIIILFVYLQSSSIHLMEEETAK
jgi:cell division protein FtsL